MEKVEKLQCFVVEYGGIEVGAASFGGAGVL
jgi:hypothetical protein